MSNFKIEKCPIDGLYIIEPRCFEDDRGYFMETYNLRELSESGFDAVFVQDNQSMSKMGVLRGLHFQKNHPQGKLVRVIKGTVYDVAVDLRKNSLSFGQWFGIYLSEENKKQFYIPAGFAHGFLVLSDAAEFCYKCTDFYDPNDEGGIAWDDQELDIKWPGLSYVGGKALLNGNIPVSISEKDCLWPSLKSLRKESCFYE